MTLVKLKNSYPGTLQGDFPTVFQDMFDRFWTEDTQKWMPSTNITEREKDYKIDLAVPGMKKEDFKIEVDNSTLWVRGERKEEFTEEKNKVTRREFHYGSFQRSFTLPETVDRENINANYADGILTLTVAKKATAIKEGKKTIAVS